MGVIKVIIVVNIVFESDLEKVKVYFDECIKIMWEIVQDMNYKYKEMLQGGLVVNILIKVLEC